MNGSSVTAMCWLLLVGSAWMGGCTSRGDDDGNGDATTGGSTDATTGGSTDATTGGSTDATTEGDGTGESDSTDDGGQGDVDDDYCAEFADADACNGAVAADAPVQCRWFSWAPIYTQLYTPGPYCQHQITLDATCRAVEFDQSLCEIEEQGLGVCPESGNHNLSWSQASREWTYHAPELPCEYRVLGMTRCGEEGDYPLVCCCPMD